MGRPFGQLRQPHKMKWRIYKICKQDGMEFCFGLFSHLLIFVCVGMFLLFLIVFLVCFGFVLYVCWNGLGVVFVLFFFGGGGLFVFAFVGMCLFLSTFYEIIVFPAILVCVWLQV